MTQKLRQTGQTSGNTFDNFKVMETHTRGNFTQD